MARSGSAKVGEAEYADGGGVGTDIADEEISEAQDGWGVEDPGRYCAVGCYGDADSTGE